MSDWGTVVAVSRDELLGLERRAVRFARARHRWRIAAFVLAGAVVGVTPALWLTTRHAHDLERDLASYKTTLGHSQSALSALSSSHEQLLEATAHAPSVGTASWGRRFEITKYVPRSADYGRFNDGLTSTMKKADPNARIAAVDPTLVPYGSRIWIEGLGWYNAQDCGSAIKGFRLDLLTATHADAMDFGRQRRFVIVVPPGDDAGGSVPASGMIGFAPNDARIGKAAKRGEDTVG
jgi:3D (Asp-Asp-Asp) domain-containing protein